MKTDSRLLALRGVVLAGAGLSALALGRIQAPWLIPCLVGGAVAHLALYGCFRHRWGAGLDAAAACLDVLLVSVLAAQTGGPASPFVYLYFPSVALLSVQHGPWCGLGLALLSSVGFAVALLSGAVGAAGSAPFQLYDWGGRLAALVAAALVGGARSRQGEVLYLYDSQLDQLEKAHEQAREQSQQRERREEELYEERRKLEALMEVAQTLAVIRNLDELLAAIVRCAQEQMNVTVAAVLLMEDGELLVRDSRGISDPGRRKLSCRVGEGLLGRLIRTSEALHFSQAQEESLEPFGDLGRFRDLLPAREGGFSQRADVFRDFLVVPMRVPQDRNPLGLLLVANLLVGDSFSPSHEGYLRILATDAAIAVRNIFSVDALKRSFDEMVQALAQAIEAKDPCTGGHVGRVKTLAVRVARALRLGEEQVDEIRVAATLHDVGKISTPDHILTKAGALTDEELQIMKAHAQNGVSVLSDIRSLPESVLKMVLHHHERWDGRGYPDGLKGVEIPLGAQIIAVADCYDAMISDRPYRSGFSPEEAMRRMEHVCGGQFNAQVLAAFFAEMGYAPRHNTAAVRAYQEMCGRIALQAGSCDEATGQARGIGGERSK